MLQEMLGDRDCDGMNLHNLASMILRADCFNDEIAFIDWVINPDGGNIMITCATSVMGHGKVMIEENTGITISEVTAWIEQNMDHRTLSNADIAESKMQQLKPLVTPLKKLTRSGAVLVLCPTMGIHHIPLHAIMIDDEQILLERNPIVYTPSFTVLHHLARVREDRAPFLQRSPRQTAVLSVYSSDKAGSLEPGRVTVSLASLSGKLGATLQSGSHVTTPFFISYTHDCDVVHFHGHSISSGDAETQALLLAPDTVDQLDHDATNTTEAGINHHVTARDILQAVSFNRNPLVVNMACSSGKNQYSAGDELFSLTPAFLLSGTTAVVGTMWPIRSADGRTFTRHLYDNMGITQQQGGGEIRQRRTVNVARALQQAALNIRDNESTEAPYHWAGFVLSGLWNVLL